MGQDIHITTHIKSNVENAYINALNLTSCPEYSEFKPFFDGRYYDLFSLFGSTRSDYKILSSLHEERCDKVNLTYQKCLEQDRDYHTFSWITIGELMKDIKDYVKQLDDPLLYYSDDEDRLAEIKNTNFNVKAWKKEVEPLKQTLLHMLKKLEYLYSYSDDYGLSSIVDSHDIIYVIYFDN